MFSSTIYDYEMLLAKPDLALIHSNDEREGGLSTVKSSVARVVCNNNLLSAGSQVRYVASSAMPVLVQGHAKDIAPADQGAAGSLGADDEQGATAQASNQV